MKTQDKKVTQSTVKRKRLVRILRGRFPFQDLFGYLKDSGNGFGHSRGR